MPHLTLEYSDNLRAEGDFGGLCRKLAQVLISQRSDDKPVYPVGGVRVRAQMHSDYCIGDGEIADAAFVHARLAIGAGRGVQVQQTTGDALFDVMKAHFASQFAEYGLALSLEISEFSEAGTWKHNNLHARYRKRA